jgi:hypothetical protein
MEISKKEFFGGLAMLACFFAVLIIVFLPLFNGKNGLNYLDDLFNSISKGSAYYIPGISQDIQKTQVGKSISVNLSYNNETQAMESVLLFQKAGAAAEVQGNTIKASGDFGGILGACLEDADTLFGNDGEKLRAKYGLEGRRVLFNWWTTLKAMEKALNKQEKFAEGKVVYTVLTRAVECSYNYYQVVPERITDRMGTVSFALIFYVIYTLWYGYAILFIFEGWGLQISH